MIELRIVGERAREVLDEMRTLLSGSASVGVVCGAGDSTDKDASPVTPWAAGGAYTHPASEAVVLSQNEMPASDNIGENAEPPEVANTAGKRRGRPPKAAEPETEVVFEKADVRKRVEQMIDAMQKAGRTQKEAFDAVRAKFDEFGATKLGDLDPAKYAAFMAATSDHD